MRKHQRKPRIYKAILALMPHSIWQNRLQPYQKMVAHSKSKFVVDV